MKRLLLLTTLPLVAFMYSFAGKQQADSLLNLSDSSAKEEVNPRAGFHNLFGTAASAGMAIKLNPQAVSFVQSYTDQYNEKLTKMKAWGRPYFDLIDNVLSKHGLPTELKYLSVIESDLKTSATSWVGAAGPWQLMPTTARELGLKVSRKNDERRDYSKSTNAAAMYLNDLHGIFNDWLLVIAAYNCGPGPVLSAIRKSGSRNFWALQNYLPAESRNHVKKFIATHYIMEGDGSVTTMTKTEADNMLGTTTATSGENNEFQTVTGKYTSAAVSQVIKMDINEFNKLNPSFDQQLAMNGTYNLRLPSDKMTAFQTGKAQILEQSVKMMLAAAGN
jgi:membrane-bound lytic murein transglycosylase D